MKKNSIKVALIAVFCMAVGFTAYTAQNKSEQLSDVALANLEALARLEITGSYNRSTGQCDYPAYKSWVSCSSGGSDECYPSDC